MSISYVNQSIALNSKRKMCFCLMPPRRTNNQKTEKVLIWAALITAKRYPKMCMTFHMLQCNPHLMYPVIITSKTHTFSLEILRF